MDHLTFEQLLAKEIFEILTPEEEALLLDYLNKNPDIGYGIELAKDFCREKEHLFNNETHNAWQKHVSKFGELLYGDSFEKSTFIKKNSNTDKSIKNKRYIIISTILLLILGTSYILTHHTKKQTLWTCYKTYDLQSKKVSLPDGSNIVLDANSQIKYDSFTFGKEKREIEFEGEGFFEISKDINKPFFVKMHGATIKVLGTAFNVKYYSGSKSLQTTLLRGKIEMSLDKHPEKRFVLIPNETIAVDYEQNGSMIANTSISLTSAELIDYKGKPALKDTIWMQQQLAFEDKTLEKLAVDLKNRYGKEIMIMDSSIGKYSYSGIIPNTSLQNTLEALSSIQPFKYTIEKERVLIYK